jgi:hypothetical protein
VSPPGRERRHATVPGTKVDIGHPGGRELFEDVLKAEPYDVESLGTVASE